jgi:CarD family transcriptional regulator
MTNFKKNDAVVYPGHGVGIVTNLETKDIFGKRQKFFTVTLNNSGMKIMLPQDNAENVGLRKVIDLSTLKSVFKLIERTKYVEQTTTWNIRYRQLMERVKSGNFLEICEAIKLIKLRKGELSFGERKLLETARELTTSELMLTLGLSYENAYDMILRKVG